MAKALTVRRIEQTIKPADIRREYPDGLLAARYLVVQPSGAKSWAVRYRHAGRPAKMTLGAYPAVTIAKARELGRDVIIAAKQGRDPGKERKAERRKAEQAAENTLEAIAEEYLTRECGMERDAKGKATFKGRLRSAPEREAALTRLVYPKLGSRQIGDIKRSEIVSLLDNIADKNGPVRADRTLAYLRKIMNWHASRRDEFRSPICVGWPGRSPRNVPASAHWQTMKSGSSGKSP
jgi:Arm DNA-binding domain